MFNKPRAGAGLKILFPVFKVFIIIERLCLDFHVIVMFVVYVINKLDQIGESETKVIKASQQLLT